MERMCPTDLVIVYAILFALGGNITFGEVDTQNATKQHVLHSVSTDSTVSCISPECNNNHIDITNKDFLYSQQMKILSENPCKEYGTCDFNKDKYLPNCYCDLDCSLYNDCCFDVSQIENSWPSMAKDMNSKRNFMQCHTGVFKKEDSNTIGVNIIGRCPFTFPLSDVKQKCHSQDHYYPVTGTDGISYNNIYCALCHNVSDYLVWTFVFQYHGYCSIDNMIPLNFTSIPEKMKYIKEKQCRYWFDPPPEAKFRICTTAANNIQIQGPNLCNSFLNPISIRTGTGRKVLYRNVFCYRENTSELEDIRPLSYCRMDVDVDVEKKGYDDLIITGLFKIRPTIVISGMKKCKAEEEYSVSLGICTPKQCEDSFSKPCNVELMKNYKWKARDIFNFIGNGTIDQNFVLRAFAMFYLSLPVEKFDLEFLGIIGKTQAGFGINSSIGECCLFKSYFQVKFKSEIAYSEIKEITSEIQNMEWSYTEESNGSVVTAWNFNKYTERERENLCNITSTYKSSNIQAYASMLYKSINMFILPNMSTAQTVVPKSFKAEAIFDPEKDKSNPKVRIKKWSFQYRYFNSTENVQRDNDWSLMTIMTYLTIGVSCIATFVTMVVYRRFGLSLKPPGEISQNVMGSILTAQVIFISAVGVTYIKMLCFIIGIISHYIWLSSFVWVSIFLMHVVKTMHQLYTSPGSLYENEKLSKWVYLFGYGLPILIVLPSAFLDLFTDIPINYVGDICFPTGYPGNLIIFTIPVMATLVTNVVALVISIVSISRFNNTTLLLNPIQNLRAYIPIYIRLCLLSACPWVLGIISEIIDSDVMRYLFIIMAGSHGTIISICFLTGTAVRQRFRQLQIHCTIRTANDMSSNGMEMAQYNN